jgi:peptidoglycan/LPS O-acetylase OafA/YrhL
MFVFLLHGRSAVQGIDDTLNAFSIFTNFPAWAGVWILFFLSGYLMQKGFLKGRYPIFSEEGRLHGRELWRFYVKRFMKIAPAYYMYIFLFLLFRYSDYFFSSPEVALRILTFTFNGNGGISGIGHLWYISLAMWFYLLAPFFYWMIRKIRRVPTLIVTVVALSACGLAYRLGAESAGWDWYDWVYTFLPANFDLFISGMLCCTLTERLKGRIKSGAAWTLKAVSCLSMLALVIYNMYVYGIGSEPCYFIYQYLLPTGYILCCGFLLVSFDTCTKKRCLPTWGAVRRNPLRLIDRFSPRTYSFYIFHLVVINYFEILLPTWERYNAWSLEARYLFYFGCCFVVSLLLAIAFDKMIAGLTAKKKTA